MKKKPHQEECGKEPGMQLNVLEGYKNYSPRKYLLTFRTYSTVLKTYNSNLVRVSILSNGSRFDSVSFP